MDWQATANIATSFTLIVAIGVFIWQIFSQRKQTKYDRSKFQLDSAVKGYNEAISVLSDGNNDRILWNSAARILTLSEAIAKRITHQDHLDVFAVALERYRKELSDILGYRNFNKGGAFFYGSENHNAPIDKAEQNTEKHLCNGHIEFITTKEIDEAALYAIWRIAQFPKDYDDPLNQRFPDDFLQSQIKRIMWPGLFEFLSHCRKHDR